MSTLSPIQLLPRHVVQLIVKHMASSNLPLFGGTVEGNAKYLALLLPLLHVCHNFRTVVYSRYCEYLELWFHGEAGRVLTSWYTWPWGYSNRDHFAYHLVREVTIKVDPLAVFNGRVHEVMLRAPYNGCSLPLARTLVFSFGPWRFENANRVLDTLDPENVRANISAFVRRVKQMAPRVNEIRLELMIDLGNFPDIAKVYLGSLATQLYQLVDRVELLSDNSMAGMALQLHEIRNLVHIKSCDSNEALTSLVRQNASTLQSLNVSLPRNRGISGIVRDVSGVYIQYPNLEKLKLATGHISEDLMLPCFPGAVPFPKLRHAALNGQYPLGDDTIFRGNAATLECLRLEITPRMLVMLREHGVFTPSHPNLRYVKICQPRNVTPDEINILVDNMDYVLGIGPDAVFRYVTDIPFCAHFPRMLTLGNKHCNLQLLTLCGPGLNLVEVITLVAELPLLADLYCGSRGLGPSVKMQPLDEFAAIMNSRLLGSGKRLRCWHLDYSNACSDNEVAVCVLLLALACPEFNHVAPNMNDDDAFKREMEQIIDLDWCLPYAPRLRRVACCSDP